MVCFAGEIVIFKSLFSRHVWHIEVELFSSFDTLFSLFVFSSHVLSHSDMLQVKISPVRQHRFILS